MAVQLKDAQIRVKLELGDAEDTVESLEKRTEKQRKEADKDERKGKKLTRETKAKVKRGGLGSAAAGVGLAAIMRRVLGAASIIAGAGIAVGEVGQRLGPQAEAMVREIMARSFGVPVGDLSLLSDFGEWWRKAKLQLTSIGTAGGETIEMGAAVGMGGGVMTKELAQKVFESSRRVAIVEAHLAAAGRRAKQTAAGKAVGEVIGAALNSLGEGDPIAEPGASLKGGPGLILPGRLDQRERQLDPESFRQGNGR